MNKNKMYSGLIISSFLIALSLFLIATPVQAVTISPTSADGLVDMWVSFEVKGANVSRTYQVALNGVNDGDAITPATDGSFVFQVTISQVGRNTITVTDTTSSTVVCTAYVNGIDILELLIPLIVLIVTVVFAMNIMVKVEKMTT